MITGHSGLSNKTVVHLSGKLFDFRPLLLILLLIVISTAVDNETTSIRNEINESTTSTVTITTEGIFTDWTIPPSTEQPPQDEEEKDDSSIEFIESAGYVLHRTVPNGEQYMLLKRKMKRKWFLPYDLCQKGENASETALRILTNLTGLTAADVSIVPNLEKIISKGKRRRIYVTTFFIANVKDPNKKIILSPGLIAYDWMYIKDAADNVAADFVEALEDIHMFVTNIINKIPKTYKRL